MLTDRDLREVMSAPGWSLSLLRDARGEPAGFFELERRGSATNLSYFGLVEDCIGKGAGRGFLDRAIGMAWKAGPSALLVNTCTADHPRALPLYIEAGFQRLRCISEIWDIPDRLGLDPPMALRATAGQDRRSR